MEEKENIPDHYNIFEPYVIVKCSVGEVKVTPHSDLMEDPVKALEKAKRISEYMQNIGVIMEIGITDEEMPF